MGVDRSARHRVDAFAICVLGLDAPPVRIGIQTPAEIDRTVIVGAADRTLGIGRARHLAGRRAVATGCQRVIGLMAQCIGDHRAAIRTVGKGYAISATRVLARNDATDGVIGEGAVAAPVLGGNAGQMLGKIQILVVIGAHPAARVRDGSDLPMRGIGIARLRHARDQNGADQGVVVVGLVDEFKRTAAAVHDGSEALAIVIDERERGTVHEALRGEPTRSVECRNGIGRVQRPVSILDQAIATAVGRLVHLADFLEGALETSGFNDASTARPIQCELGAKRVCPTVAEPTRRGGYSRMVVARQCDPAQIEVLRDLVLLTGLYVTGVAYGAVARGLILIGAAGATPILVALRRLRGKGSDEFLIDTGFVLVRPISHFVGTVEPPHS
ncbi:hypothetical protein D3C71_1228570 [compost metagenome]